MHMELPLTWILITLDLICANSLILMHIEILNNSSVGKMRETGNFDSSEANDWNVNVWSDGLKGPLLIGGVWGRGGDQELQGIKSRIGILVNRRKR